MIKKVKKMIIDFDNKFRLYLANWLEKNAEKFESPEEMEAQALNVYSLWIDESAEWLNGLRPAEYFAKVKTTDELVEKLVEYLNLKIGIPDLLLDEISKRGNDAKSSLTKLFNLSYEIDEKCKTEARMIAINLLSESDDSFLYGEYVKILLEKDANEEIVNLIIEKLKYADKEIAEELIHELKNLDDEEIDMRCMDVLVNFPADDRIYQMLIGMFNEYSNTALLAAYLGKYGDDRAIDILEEALDWEGINYLDYIEIRNSIEELGKEVDHVRSFEGDTYYESLKNI